MLSQLRNRKKNNRTLLTATISLLMFSSSMGVAGETGNVDGIPTPYKTATGAGFGVATYFSVTKAYQLSKAASAKKASLLSEANRLQTQAQKPYAQELENFDDPKLKEAEAKIKKLEEEQNILSAQLKALKHAQNPAEQLKAEQLEAQLINQRNQIRETSLAGYQKDMSLLRSWFPFDAVNKVNKYLQNGGKEGPGVPKPTQAELELWKNLKIQRGLIEYQTLNQQIKKIQAAQLRDEHASIANSSVQEAHVQPVSIQDAEKRLSHIRKELTELKVWYPAASIEEARIRDASVRQIASSNFEASPKHFTLDEATELLSKHEKIKNMLTQSESITKALKRDLRPHYYISAVSIGGSVLSFASAISDRFTKSEATARSERDSSSEERSQTANAGKLQ